MNSPLSHGTELLGAVPMTERPFEWVGELSGFLRRNKRLLVASVVATTLLALLYVATATPRFTASTILLIDTRQAALFQQHPTVADAQIESALIESEVEVLHSAGLARQVVADLGLAADPVFNSSSQHALAHASLFRLPFWSNTAAGPSTAAEDRLVQQFLGSVSAHRVGLTYIIEIDATAKTRELSARLANGLADTYLAQQLAVKNRSTRQAAEWLEARLAQLRDQALTADQEVQRFKSAHGIVETGHGDLDEQQLTELNSQLAAAHGRTAEASARLDRIRQMMRPGSDPAMAVSDVLKSPVIDGLRERYLNDATRAAQWSVQYGREHGATVLLRREMAQLQAAIISETRRIEQTAESELSIARAGETSIQAQLDTLVRRNVSTDTARATLRSLQSAADAYRTLYVAFLQRASQAAQDEVFPVADARVVTQARPPLTKSWPQSKLILVAAIVLGLGIGFALALLRESLDSRLSNPRALRADTGFSCLASLPAVEPAPPSGLAGWRRVLHLGGAAADAYPDATMDTYAFDHPDSPFGLGLRRLQLRVQQHGDAGKTRLVGLVAPLHGSGTSTVAAGLVQSLVRSGHRAALLVLPREAGVRTDLAGQIDALRREHEFVVVDVPSLDRPVEAHALLGTFDSLILLVAAGRSNGPALLETLRASGVDRRSIMGAVLNRVRPGA